MRVDSNFFDSLSRYFIALCKSEEYDEGHAFGNEGLPILQRLLPAREHSLNLFTGVSRHFDKNVKLSLHENKY